MKFGNKYFNSHPHEEDDLSGRWCTVYGIYFNSHPHEEDDKVGVIQNFPRYYFNSHPHEEDDWKKGAVGV